MKTTRQLLSLSLVTLSLGSALQAGNTPVPVRNLNHDTTRHTGLITSGNYTGSGVIARHPKVMVSCAHVPFDTRSGTYRSMNFHLRHNSSALPRSAGHRLRGFYRWNSYASNVRRYGQTASATFHADLTAGYSHANLAGGGYAGWWNNGTPSLRSASTYKAVTGYPVARTRNYRMHYTGNFRSAFGTMYGRYLWNNNIAVGGGNSGGPVWTWNSQGRDWRLAGILVSGNASGGFGTGVIGLDANAHRLLNYAVSKAKTIRPVSRTRTFSASSRLGIADASRVWQNSKVRVSGMGSSTSAVTVNVDVRHTYKGDMKVYLRAPNGRGIYLHNRTGGSANNIIISGKSLTSMLRGSNPNGTWTLFLKDEVRGDTGYLNRFSVRVTTR